MLKHSISRLLGILFIQCCCCSPLFSHTINGVVSNQQAERILHAKVTLIGEEKSVFTNGLGEFVMQEVHLGDTISIERTGYEKLIVSLDREDYFNNDYSFVLYEKVTHLSEVLVTKNQTSVSQTANIDLVRQPVRSSQELLTLVPGLFIAQHAGGGKAEQLFLRGFDIDHGTDVAIAVDGMPVNMVSHAHGQGYADLHFLMPEVVEKIDFAKGPYDITKGNFATAGNVEFRTKDRLERSMISGEYGMFHHKRITTAMNIVDNPGKGQNAYFAADYMLTDNYFVSPQDFHRFNVIAKYTGRVSPNTRLTASVSTFQSSWNASGQIPERAVKSGLISRFGAIDNTEGGQTSRTNIQFGIVSKLPGNVVLTSDFYLIDYRFTLYSNFTFFLIDSVNGDQIKQDEQRKIYGGKTEWKKFMLYENGWKLTYFAGIGFRYDDIDHIGLASTSNRTTLMRQIQLGNIDETNMFGYARAQFEAGKWVFNIGLRADVFNFYYVNLLDSLYQPKNLSQAVLLPKMNIIYNTSEKLQLFLKSGIGYHSNDTRVILAGETDNLNRKVLPLAYGTDLGFTWKPARSLLINTALWYLFSEQEFVYVGDAGIVEPNGRSQRLGGDFGITFQPVTWLFIYSNVNYAHARLIDEPKEQNYVPLAPRLTSNGKIQVNLKNGLFATLSYRYMADRPSNEENSVIAKGYFVNDFSLGIQRNRFTITGIVNNLFNVAWNETQFLTTSRLKNESQAVEEIHFTPGTPLACRVQLKIEF